MLLTFQPTQRLVLGVLNAIGLVLRPTIHWLCAAHESSVDTSAQLLIYRRTQMWIGACKDRASSQPARTGENEIIRRRTVKKLGAVLEAEVAGGPSVSWRPPCFAAEVLPKTSVSSQTAVKCNFSLGQLVFRALALLIGLFSFRVRKSHRYLWS